MPRPSEPRASTCRTGPRIGLDAAMAVTMTLAMIVGSLAPRPAHAAPSEVPSEVQEHYNRGANERDAGHFDVAAAEFTEAYAGMPVSQKAQRIGLLFDLVDARRLAFGAGGRIRGREHPAAHLCAANKVLGEFIDKAEKDRKGKGKRSGDVVKAMELRTEVRAQLDAARVETPELDCATAEYPREGEAEAAADPAPEPKPPRTPRKIDKPLVIAGAAVTGFGLIMVGLMAGGLVRGKRAEDAGDAFVTAIPTASPDNPDLLAIDRRGKSGNQMAIAGGVLGALALGTGVALLVLGLRGRPSRVAVAPTMSPRGGGLTLRWQF